MSVSAGLADRDVQAQLLLESIVAAKAGYLVWDETGTYIAVNDEACAILGATREQLLGTKVGAHTAEGPSLVGAVLARETSSGTIAVSRLDGRGTVRLAFISFRTKTAGMPYMGSLVVPIEPED